MLHRHKNTFLSKISIDYMQPSEMNKGYNKSSNKLEKPVFCAFLISISIFIS